MKPDWEELLAPEREKEYYQQLWRFVESEYETGEIYPQKENIFAALDLTGYCETKVIILGQDPYHGPGQAHGLSFSVGSEAAKFPPSLRNIFKELESDLGIVHTDQNLTGWAQQGVLLLNTVLTVRAGQAASHRGKGWERFTDSIIMHLNDREEPVVFLLWGGDAKKKVPLITGPQHRIITSVHPSPLSARGGFFGSKPFSAINRLLGELSRQEIDWAR